MEPGQCRPRVPGIELSAAVTVASARRQVTRFGRGGTSERHTSRCLSASCRNSGQRSAVSGQRRLFGACSYQLGAVHYPGMSARPVATRGSHMELRRHCTARVMEHFLDTSTMFVGMTRAESTSTDDSITSILRRLIIPPQAFLRHEVAFGLNAHFVELRPNES